MLSYRGTPLYTFFTGKGVIEEVQKSGVGYFQILCPGMTRESISTLSSELCIINSNSV